MVKIFKTNTDIPVWLQTGIKFQGKWIAEKEKIQQKINEIIDL